MLNHLCDKHYITNESHQARLMGYIKGTGAYIERGWSGKSKEQARLTAQQATRRWVVKTRQPFSVVDQAEF
jgi:hypothetical protein